MTGHTASLFPDSPALDERERIVAPNFVAELSAYRLTFTPKLINAAANVLFLIAGADKARALAAVLEYCASRAGIPRSSSRRSTARCTGWWTGPRRPTWERDGSMARIPYRDPEGVPDEIARMMDVQRGRSGFVMNVTRAMANSPELLRRTNSLAMCVTFHSSLHPVLKELAILTVGRLTGETYLHERHLRSVRDDGITPEQIAELENWARAPCFDDYQRGRDARYAWQATGSAWPSPMRWRTPRWSCSATRASSTWLQLWPSTITWRV